MIAQATGRNNLIYRDGTTDDIIKVILETNALPIERQTVKLSQKIPLSYEGLRQLWQFVKFNISYKEDPLGVQWVKEPARLWRDDVGDCKSFTLFMCSVFKNWGIPYTIRFVAFSKNSEYSHVYPIAYLNGKAVIMDAVLKAFDQQKSFSKKIDYNFGDMTKISRLSGIGAEAASEQLTAIEAYYTAVNADLPQNIGADITEMTEAEAIQYLSGGAAVTGIGSTAKAFTLPILILPTSVSGNIFTKIGDAIKTAAKNVINAIFKGPLKAVGPVFLYMFLDKKATAAVESKKLQQTRFVSWVANVCGTTPQVVLATMSDGIKTHFGGKSPQEVIVAAQKGEINGIGFVGFATLLPIILEIIQKIITVFKKNKSEVPDVGGSISDLGELKDTPAPELPKTAGAVIIPPVTATEDGKDTTTTTTKSSNTKYILVGGALVLAAYVMKK